MRRILLAADLSKASRQGFTTALRVAQRNRGTVTILHVIAPLIPMNPDQDTAFAAWDGLEAQGRVWAQRELNKLTAKAKKAGVRRRG